MSNLPPPNRVPQNTEGMPYYEILDYYIGSWGPLPDGKGSSTQVHVQLNIKNFPAPLVLRFKSAEAIDLFIAALMRHRNDVWPGVWPGDCKEAAR